LNVTQHNIKKLEKKQNFFNYKRKKKLSGFVCQFLWGLG